MPPKRTYIPCHKCGKNSIGRYKDDEGNTLCSGCKSIPRRITMCTICSNGHYDTANTGTCNSCRAKEARRSTTVRRCLICDRAMRTTLETMTECVNCIGRAKYQRLRTAAIG